MLCLRRKIGETVLLGGSVTVTVMEVSASGAVVLGFTAPEDMLIVRSELAGRFSREPAADADCPSGAPDDKGTAR